MKFKTLGTWGFEGAIHGMRNPLESWSKSDSYYKEEEDFYLLGPNDLDLASRLIKAGSEHRKFLRYIHVQVDITAPLYWWKELDTYKIGTTANSTSTMHKLASTPITLACFETDDYKNDLKIFDNEPYREDTYLYDSIEYIIDVCESLRKQYLETKDIRYWKELIRWLPEAWLQTRTVDLNYEVLRNIVHQRSGHKLTEWHQFVDWVHTLPYSKEFIFDNN